MKDSQHKQLFCSSTDKACYTEREAGIIINSAHRRRYSDKIKWRNNIPRRKYYCPECGFYHITHEPLYSGNKDRKKKRIG